MAFFKLKSGTSYDCRSRKTGILYNFVGFKPVGITEPIDLDKFRGMRDMFVETDSAGNEIACSPSAIPMAFTSHGMVPPKSYVKLARPAPAPASVPAPAAQAAPRRIASTKAPEPPAEAPTPKPAAVAPVAAPATVVEAPAVAQAAPGTDQPSSAKKARRVIRRSKKSGVEQPQQ